MLPLGDVRLELWAGRETSVALGDLEVIARSLGRMLSLPRRCLRVEAGLRPQAGQKGGGVHPSGWANAGRTDCVRQLAPVLERAGVPIVRPHDARHTTATLLLGQGVHPKLVSEMLDHTTLAITLDPYSHATPAMHREAGRVLDTLLRFQ
jgi:integrase